MKLLKGKEIKMEKGNSTIDYYLLFDGPNIVAKKR